MPLVTRGVREQIARHRMLARRHRDLRPVMTEVAREVRDVIAASWASETSPGGEPWPPTQRRSESRGRLERAADVQVTRTGFRLLVSSLHASYVFFGTRHQPARNPLPIEPRGGRLVWVMRGAAGELFDRLLGRTRAYLSGTDGRR